MKERNRFKCKSILYFNVGHENLDATNNPESQELRTYVQSCGMELIFVYSAIKVTRVHYSAYIHTYTYIHTYVRMYVQVFTFSYLNIRT